ncbi:ABC transporter ATP-binding protein [Duganella radicis]|uniref:ATP-binding cassette domain-containing protein n=1 Tax=Duganella radicis TaxID=551988 RepID=A0A6L6PIB6_9BURK|nr:ABC transporter ATP-binding protein [Duganella radicis]MTV38025.1 ATP-binding cassette domain-containing protein [Duganella radicis]
MDLPLAIECTGISKRYPHFALHSVDLACEQGTVMGLVGPNGAGKSTIMRMVMGLVAPDAGTVRVLGHAMPERQVAAKRNIGFIAEDMRLYESETIGFHMAFIQSIFDSWDEDYANTLLRRFDLNRQQKVKGLSHGQRVKATLLLALARRPSLLVFDEPTTGLDPAVRKEVLDEMMNAMADETRSILFSSHNTADVEQISDYITFIYGGRIVESRNKEDFMDGWRRLRLTNRDNQPLPELPNLRGVQHSGRLCALTVNEYDESLPARLSGAGLAVQAVERLTLEEIFLANVKHAKAEFAQ